MNADTTVLRGEVTHRLAPYLPADAVAPVADATVTLAGTFGDQDPAEVRKAVVGAALALVPPQYRLLAGVAMALQQAVSAWLDARVVEVQAGSVTVTDRRAA